MDFLCIIVVVLRAGERPLIFDLLVVKFGNLKVILAAKCDLFNKKIFIFFSLKELRSISRFRLTP